MNFTFFATLSILVVLVSCHHEETHNPSHSPDGHLTQPKDTEHSPSEAHASRDKQGLDALELNEGRKWEMDDHTRASFSAMANSFLNQDYSTLEGEALRREGAVLGAELDDLIQGCTMTGAAHDQLHVYLTGYIPAVAALTENGRAAEAQEVQLYLEKYGDFFE